MSVLSTCQLLVVCNVACITVNPSFDQSECPGRLRWHEGDLCLRTRRTAGGSASAQWRPYIDALHKWHAGRLGEAVSGDGSTWSKTEPFVQFFAAWLRTHRGNVTSLVEASAGHWPSGWQREMPWPPLQYTGLDILPELIADNWKLVRFAGTFGLSNLSFKVLDMLKIQLPCADLLVTKDTLMHFTNAEILHFLRLSVAVCPPRFRYVMFTHDQYDKLGSTAFLNNAISPTARSRAQRLDLAAAPFNLPVRPVFKWGDKVVELLVPSVCCLSSNYCRLGRP